MNESLYNKLSEISGSNNISFMLNDNNDFSVTGYKVMQNHIRSGLLRCTKIMYNGKIKLVYLVGENRSLSQVTTMLGVNELNSVIFNLIQRALLIKSNGFFRVENLELDFNKIFVDMSNYSVSFIYYPVSGGATGKISTFENEIRITLINLFNSFPIFSAPQFQYLCSDLANASLPLDVILKKLQNNINTKNCNTESSNDNKARMDYDISQNEYKTYISNHYPGFKNNELQKNTKLTQPELTLTAINSPVQKVLTVNQQEYLIGKNPDMVDGVITYNPAVSRVHCKIFYTDSKYYLTDMNSANGTYINHKRLEKNQTIEITSGDYLRLANSDFVISF